MIKKRFLSLIFLFLSRINVAFSFIPLRSINKIRQYQLHAVSSEKQITDNKKSTFEYEFTERYEAGIMLTGTEVKSCRKGMVQLSDSMAEIIDGECWLLNCHIAEHDRCSTINQHKPKRTRKLLLNKKEILKLEQRVLQRNCEIIPLRMYFIDNQRVKVELGVGMKKTMGDKRDGEMKREGERDIRRTMKGSGGYD
mmetsp:Transcript_18195/g.17534  ORF Transcript_18195/g.17534 Transcript_18195/m.17534 type:complete len:196 (+) Transcript_18195:80-667(+)